MKFLCGMLLLILLVITGCSTNNNAIKTELPTQITTNLKSQANLDLWAISLVPKLTENKWVCDIDATYLGDSPTGNVSIQAGGAKIQTSQINPNESIKFSGYVLQISQDIQLKLNWIDKGKELNGNAVFEVNAL
jgi:hypothetical protein